MGRNPREEIFDRRMKTNIYDDTSLEEIRGRIRRIDGHRTSSLSDIKNFQNSIDVSTLKGKDNSTILISESTLLELKHKVDESETQKHFMNALKERLKETTHEKDILLKKTQADKETIRKNNEEIELLREEITKLNGNILELKGILESSKQRIAELESSNDGNNIMTEVDMQSRIESMADCTFRNKEIKTLQDELMFNNDLSSNISEASSKVTVKSNIRHVLFNDKTEKFVGDLKVGINNLGTNFDNSENVNQKSIRDISNKLQDYENESNATSNSHKCQISTKHNWMRMVARLNGFIYFKSKMILIKQYLADEEMQLLGDVSLENNSSNNNSSNAKIGKKSINIGYSGPSENKIRMVFSPLKIEVNEIIYRLEKNGEDDEEYIFTEKKHLLSKLDEQIAVLKEKIEIAGSVSSKTSISSSRVISFSDIATEKDSMQSISVINSSRSSKFSEKMKSSFDNVFMINRRLLFILARLKLWILEETLYDEQVLDGSISSKDEYDQNSSRNLLDYFENAYEFIINREDNETYPINNNDYLSIGIVQMLYILNKQWERSISNENRLLNQLQEMVRIYHRMKNYLLAAPKNSYHQNSKDLETEYSLNNSEIDNFHLSNENNYVFELEKELTSLGLGIFSGRDLNGGNNVSRSINNKEIEQATDTVIALNSKDKANNHETSGNIDGLLSREQVNDILKHLEDFPDPYIANRNEILSIRELIRPLKSYGRRAPEPYIGFFAMMTQRLDNDIVQHDREIRAFQKVIKGLEDQCDRQQEELEELHEELEQLYEIIETKYDEHSVLEQEETEDNSDKGVGKGEEKKPIEKQGNNSNSNNSSQILTDHKEKNERKLSSQISDKEWINLCKQTSLGLSDKK
ncbi:uncharacterized protein cubi_01972 [Cryptosporidium ubiquitum]|uniref:Uncharacterized protein n=1 Tax=Cryptosporidium ubiquitum TaxID=857276 RepID=A0A1J4MPS7_9CRYT|nr:uncharacterized protein cubi_01972 [Cryptosporidium ubiquitum]OII75451.1 hypothetical protein cubi_01972 [Cryptosporidium ubiquitum]